MTTAPIPRLIGSLAVPTAHMPWSLLFMSWLILILWVRLTHSRRLRLDFFEWPSFRLSGFFSGMDRVIIFLVSWEPRLRKCRKNGIYMLFDAFMLGAIIALFGHFVLLKHACRSVLRDYSLMAEEYLGTIVGCTFYGFFAGAE